MASVTYTIINSKGKWARLNCFVVEEDQVPHGIMDALKKEHPNHTFANIVYEERTGFKWLYTDDPLFINPYPQKQEDMQPFKIIAFCGH